MAGMGPAPRPPGVDGKSARRRNATAAMTRLPAAGRTGKTPAWPLLDDIEMAARLEVTEGKAAQLRLDLDRLHGARRASAQRKLDALEVDITVLTVKIRKQRGLERKIWREVWATPQAVAWERLGWTREVAQYVRWRVLGELGDLEAAREARQLSDRLGLTPLAMLRLRWEIAPDEVAEHRQERAENPRPAARRRMRVVDPDAVAGT